MRILHLLDWHMYYAVQLANALAVEHEIMFLTRDHPFEISGPDSPVTLDSFLDETLDPRIRRETLRFRQGSTRNIKELARILRKLREFDPDIVHVQENTDWRILWLARKLGFGRMVLTIHDVRLHPGEPEGATKLLRRVFRSRAKRIIVHGERLKVQLEAISRKAASKAFVVPHGAHAIYKKWDTASIREESNTILFFGRISDYKGIDLLIRSEPLVAREIPDLRIIVAGRGAPLEKYERLIGQNGHFEIHDRFIPNAEVPGLFRRASVVVLPYREASQSGVALVACVFGKPVVATSVGSIPEVVEAGRTGLLVPPDDPEALSGAILSLLKNPVLRSDMGKKALARASAELSWEEVSKKVLKVYASA